MSKIIVWAFATFSAFLGGLIGIATGYVAAHNFPLWGGLLLFSKPYSPARDTLVPGHALFFATIFATIGFIVAFFIARAIHVQFQSPRTDDDSEYQCYRE